MPGCKAFQSGHISPPVLFILLEFQYSYKIWKIIFGTKDYSKNAVYLEEIIVFAHSLYILWKCIDCLPAFNRELCKNQIQFLLFLDS